MSDLAMSHAEQDAFLTEVRVGVLGVARPDAPPSLTPVWYRYTDGVVEIVTAGSTAKLALLREAGSASLCVQQEQPPYRYVTVEGPVEVTATPDGLVETIASRYLGDDEGRAYASGPGQQDDTLIRLTVTTRRSIDFSKLG